MKNIFVLAALCLCSCTGKNLETYTRDVRTSGEITVHLSGICSTSTKGSLLEGADNICSGAAIYVFRHLPGGDTAFESWHPVSAEFLSRGEGDLTLRVPLGSTLDFYVVGNLWGIDRESGEKMDMAAALGYAFPSSSDDLERLDYRFGAEPLGERCRTETMDEVKLYGIPFAGSAKDVSPASDVNVPCKYLFAKLRLTVDHSGFDADGNHSSGSCRWFTNSSVALMQVCNRLQPFGDEPQRILSSEDVSVVADGDFMLSNTDGSTENVYEFFIPENMQGTLLPAGTNQRGKTPEALAAAGHDPSLCSYLEFTGRLSPDAAGFGGDYTYRFFLGNDNNRNFDVERGLQYDVRLSFRPEAIFDPSWMVNDNGTFSDGRLFRLTADAAFSTPLGDTSGNGQMVAVRKNRPGKLYVYMNKDGALSGKNELKGKQIRDRDYQLSSIRDCAWTGDFINQSGTASMIPQRAALSRSGISATYDPDTACLTFAVVDEEAFEAHLGQDIPLSVTLLPSGRTVSFSVKSFDDISASVEDGTLEGDDFFVGMRRRVIFSGFAGEKIHYYNDISSSSPSMKAFNSSSSFAFIGDKTVPGQIVPVETPFDVYSCRDNYSGRRCTLAFESDDVFNDGTPVYVKCLAHPVYPGISFAPSGAEHLFLTGDETMFAVTYYDSPSRSDVIHRDRFDDFAYSDCLMPTCGYECDSFDPTGIACHQTESFLSSTGYEVYGVYVSSLPSDVYRSTSSHTVNLMFSASGVGEGNFQPYELTIPAFDYSYDPSGASSASIADIHDYSLLKREWLAEEYRTKSASSSAKVKFGVLNAEDVKFEFDKGARYLSAEVGSASVFTGNGVLEPKGGEVKFLFSDYESLNADGSTHPAGPVTITPYSINKHSGQKIVGSDYLATIYVHVAVGACAFRRLGENLEASFDIYAWIVGRNTAGKVAFNGSTINELLSVQYSDYSGQIALDPNSVTVSGERTETLSGPLPDEGASINGEPYVNVTWSVTNASSSVYQEILTLNSSSDGLAFFGENGIFSRPRFVFWDVNRQAVLNGPVNLDIDGYKDPASGKGYYFLDDLSVLCPETHGWLNIYENWGMPVGFPTPYYPVM